MNIFRWVILISFLFFAWWVWMHSEEFVNFFYRHTPEEQIVTFEKQVDAYQLLQDKKEELLTIEGAQYKEPQLEYYPYVILDISYDGSEFPKKSKEGILIWGLYDGELVRNTAHWETTRGIGESIDQKADTGDYNVIRAIEENGGEANINQIQMALKKSPQEVENWVNSALSKHLILKKGSQYSLRIPPAYLNLFPKTQVAQPLITKTYTHASKAPTNYSEYQIRNAAKSIFGPSLIINSSKVVYLPVYNVDVITSDKTVHQTSWNALTGDKFVP